jgi:aerobic carbon-monoxide dehydrogenase large subunit
VTSKTYKGRREDLRLLTGRGQYASDWNLPDQLHGYFLRSDRAHAAVRSLATKPALQAPGVVAVLTGKDVIEAGFASAPTFLRAPGRGGMRIRMPHRHVLAHERVRYVGQEVALVVARTALQAQDAAELIEADYEELPAVVDAERALAPGAPQLYPDAPGNLCYDYEYGDEAKTNEAFARAAHVTRIELDAQRMLGNPMEPKAALAAWDPAADTYHLYSPTQGMSITLHALHTVMGVPREKLRVHARDVGGGFGIRTDAYPEYIALLLAARKLGRPVKWVSSRSETFLSDYHARAAKLTGELALGRDGSFLGLRIRWIVNGGAYLSMPGPLINTINPAAHAVNAYRIPALYGRHIIAFTNTTPSTAYRGAGRPNVSYLAERLVEEAARETGIDRVELRRRNLIGKDAFPYTTPVGSVYDSGDPPGELEEAIRRSEWSTFEARRAEAKRRGRLRGIGCAAFIEPAGGGTAPKEEAMIKFGESGNALVYLLAGPSGQGHETVYPEVVGEIFGMDPERITLRASDPDGPALVGEGTIASRSMMSHGGAAVAAAREVVKKGLELAAKDLEVAAKDLEFVNGRYRVKGTDISVSLERLAARHAGSKEHPLDARGEIPLPKSFPGGVHVAEVEIDPETGVIDVPRYTAVDDVGRIINHVLLEGQMHGGIVQGLGQVVNEHAIYDETTGQLLTGSFMDYEMPRADGAPREYRLVDHSVPSPANPLGAKGAGEAGTIGAVPAIANAVIDALRPLGIHHLDPPCTPDRVWRAIRDAKR